MKTLANLVGTISEVSNSTALARVDFGDRTTDWIPILMMASPFKRHWTPLCVGEQVAVFGGDMGFGIRGFFCDDIPEPSGSTQNVETIEYQNGNTIIINLDANTVTISGFHSIINGDFTVNGNLTVNGTIADSIGILTDHTHKGVMSGGSTTGGRK
jgi:phage baseplate assembly protein V